EVGAYKQRRIALAHVDEVNRRGTWGAGRCQKVSKPENDQKDDPQRDERPSPTHNHSHPFFRAKTRVLQNVLTRKTPFIIQEFSMCANKYSGKGLAISLAALAIAAVGAFIQPHFSQAEPAPPSQGQGGGQ